MAKDTPSGSGAFFDDDVKIAYFTSLSVSGTRLGGLYEYITQYILR